MSRLGLMIAWLGLTLTAPTLRADDAEIAKKAGDILKVNCHRCHGHDGANEGGFNYVLDRGQLVNRGKKSASSTDPAGEPGPGDRASGSE